MTWIRFTVAWMRTKPTSAGRSHHNNLASTKGTMAHTGRLPEPLVSNYEWQANAACRGMDPSNLFHPAVVPRVPLS